MAGIIHRVTIVMAGIIVGTLHFLMLPIVITAYHQTGIQPMSKVINTQYILYNHMYFLIENIKLV